MMSIIEVIRQNPVIAVMFAFGLGVLWAAIMRWLLDLGDRAQRDYFIRQTREKNGE